MLLSDGGTAPVDVDDCAVDVAGGGGGKERDDVGDLMYLRDPA